MINDMDRATELEKMSNEDVIPFEHNSLFLFYK